MSEQQWTVYLSGEIHTGWRDEISAGTRDAGLPVTFLSPVTDHAASDDCGVDILGNEDYAFWKDHKGAKVNAIRKIRSNLPHPVSWAKVCIMRRA